MKNVNRGFRAPCNVASGDLSARAVIKIWTAIGTCISKPTISVCSGWCRYNVACWKDSGEGGGGHQCKIIDIWEHPILACAIQAAM
jgi:hypothetical protein